MGLAVDHGDFERSTLSSDFKVKSGLFERGGTFYLWPTNLPRKASKLAILKMMIRSPFSFTLVYLLICFYIDTLMQAIVESRSVATIIIYPCFSKFVLPDIGFDIFKNYTNGRYADLCLVFVAVFTAARFLATNYMRWTIIRRWILVLSTLFLIRAFAIISTMLPNPSNECVLTAAENTDSVFYTGLMILLFQKRTCADLLFSGHTVNLTLCALVWQTYSHVTPITNMDPLSSYFRMPLTSSNRWDLNRMTLPKWAIWCLAVLGYILILVTRMHYTADVYIGCILTCLVWKLYHHYIRTAHERSNSLNRLICWMECNADDLHPATDSSRLPTICTLPHTGAVTHHKLNVSADANLSSEKLVCEVGRTVLGAYQESMSRWNSSIGERNQWKCAISFICDDNVDDVEVVVSEIQPLMVSFQMNA